MHWIDRAENKFGHLAIPGLLRFVAGLNALCYVLFKLNPHTIDLLALDPDLILKGEVWRVVTYIFIPRVGTANLDWFFAAMYLYYFIWIGDGLEQAMGSFRLNLYYLLGIIGTTAAAFIVNADPSGATLNTSLLFAFARFYPDTTTYVMMLLPVKVKWMAWATAAIFIVQFTFGTWPTRAAIIAAVANYFLFFGRDIADEAKHRHEVAGRQRRFERDSRPTDEAMHRCAVCGRTELVAPELDFRVARDGEEYCTEHLPKPTVEPPPAQA